jgi:hypothetical protein
MPISPGTHDHLARVYQAKGNYTESVEVGAVT